jgi:DAK2 domain fusion protein YloV
MAVKQPYTTAVVRELDGRLFKQMIVDACKNLEAKRELVDAMNIFPVADGDTGTNMWLTLQAAVQAVDRADDRPLDEILPCVARQSLLGARGNSGVILSQFFEGFARSLAGKKTARIKDLARGIKKGFERAYKTVARPMEGTILTVMREASIAANRFYHDDLVRWGHKILERARRAERKTRTMLPALKRAGVSDAGGLGFVYVLEAFYTTLKNKKIPRATGKIATLAVKTRLRIAKKISDLPRFRYCLEFIIKQIRVSVSVVKRKLRSFGDSILVAKIKDLVHIHIHTDEPERVRAVSSAFGEFSQVKLDDIRLQHEESFVPPGRAGFGVVAVARGSGLIKIFKNLGAEAVIASRHAVAVKELVSALEALPVKKVVLLPNDGNLILAARQAQKLIKKTIFVIPSQTIPEGIQSLLALNTDEPFADNVKAMTEARVQVKSGTVSVAVRPGSGDGVRVKKGDYVGMSPDKIVAKAQSPQACLAELVGKLVSRDSQLVVIYYGAGLGRAAALSAVGRLKRTFPKLDIQSYYGGQPVNFYLVGVS